MDGYIHEEERDGRTLAMDKAGGKRGRSAGEEAVVGSEATAKGSGGIGDGSPPVVVTKDEVSKGTKVVQELENKDWGMKPEWCFDTNLKYALDEDEHGNVAVAVAADDDVNDADPPAPPVAEEQVEAQGNEEPKEEEPRKLVEHDGESEKDHGQEDPSKTKTKSKTKTVFIKRCCNVSCGNRDIEKEKGYEEKLLKCGRCGACYCCKACQKRDWKMRHKRECPIIKQMDMPGDYDFKLAHEIMEEMLRGIRMYMCPYAVGFSQIHGGGFVMLRSNETLKNWIYGPGTLDKNGKVLSRYVQLEYLTLGEFDALMVEDDFELGLVRPALAEALEKRDLQKQVVVVIVLRCGYFGCVTLPLVPDYGICAQLSSMYGYSNMDGPLRLNVDLQD